MVVGISGKMGSGKDLVYRGAAPIQTFEFCWTMSAMFDNAC